jgi:hypothetical protein
LLITEFLVGDRRVRTAGVAGVVRIGAPNSLIVGPRIRDLG